MRPRKLRKLISGLLAFAALFLTALPPLCAQSPDEILPEESAAKARAILQQTIAALGGPAYLGIQDSDCSARFASMRGGAMEAAGASVEIHVLHMSPDKLRLETHGDNYITDLPLPGLELHGRSVITRVYTADHVLVFDKTGVVELGDDDVKLYHDQLLTDLDYMLRSRLNEPGMIFRWAGFDVVDLKEVDWVEISDADHRVVRIAVDRNRHLPVRKEVLSRDPKYKIPIEDAVNYTNYHAIQGIQTPYRISTDHNGQMLTETFYEGCRYNTGMAPALFTREGLEASRTAKVKPAKR